MFDHTPTDTASLACWIRELSDHHQLYHQKHHAQVDARREMSRRFTAETRVRGTARRTCELHARTLQLQAIALPHPHRSTMAPSERAPQPEWRSDGSVGGWRGLSLHATRPRAIGDPLHCASEARDRWRRLSACPCATSLKVADACQQYHWCDDVQSLNSRPNCLMMLPTQSPPRVRQHVCPTAS